MGPRTKEWRRPWPRPCFSRSGATLGSQSGDHSAQTGAPTTPSHASPTAANRNLTLLAGKLGVSTAELRDAMIQLRGDRQKALKAAQANVAKQLSRALGIPEAKVRTALARPQAQGALRKAYARELAARLGIDGATVRSAMRAQRLAGRPPSLSALATRLGVSAPQLRVAVNSLRPVYDRRRRAARVTAVAKELGISEARAARRAEAHPRRPRAAARGDAQPARRPTSRPISASRSRRSPTRSTH